MAGRLFAASCSSFVLLLCPMICVPVCLLVYFCLCVVSPLVSVGNNVLAPAVFVVWFLPIFADGWSL